MEQKIKELIKTRDSTQSNVSSPEEARLFTDAGRQIQQFSNQYRLELFENAVEGNELSQKAHQKAINWMITMCWMKNLNQDCLWEMVLLYYACKAKRNILKAELELIMLACLSLSLKMTSNKVYSTKQIASLSSQPTSPSDIIQMESILLDLVDYNLVIPHQLEQLYFLESLSEEQKNETLLICELLMIKDYTIFVDSAKLRQVFQLLSEQELNKQLKIYDQIKQLWCLKESKTVLSKYSSKMDALAFKQKFV